MQHVVEHRGQRFRSAGSGAKFLWPHAGQGQESAEPGGVLGQKGQCPESYGLGLVGSEAGRRFLHSPPKGLRLWRAFKQLVTAIHAKCSAIAYQNRCTCLVHWDLGRRGSGRQK